MIITTARKPSPKTRRFCRHLGRFTGCDYVPRGKTGLAALGDEPFLVVGEYKGNPGSFNFYMNGISILSIRANVSMNKEIEPGETPVIEGSSSLAVTLGKATGFKTGGSSERVIRINDQIEFIDKDEPVIVLKILKGEGIVRPFQERRDQRIKSENS